MLADDELVLEKFEEKGGLGFIFSLPSNLSTEMSFSQKFSESNSKLRLSMMHNLSASYEAKKLILEDKVNLIILIGSCYSKLPELNYGDLIYVSGYLLPKKSCFKQGLQLKNLNQIFYLQEKREDLSDRIENFLEKESKNLANLFNKYQFQTFSNNKLVSGLIFSGETFCISEACFNELKIQYPLLLAGDIEGVAVSKICEKYNIPLISIKMVFPELNTEENSSKTWISLHKESVEVFFKEFIKDLSDFFSKNS